VKRLLAAALASSLAPVSLAAQAKEEKAIVVRAAPGGPVRTFDALWAEYRKADLASDADTRSKVLGEIVQLRVERNIRSLEENGLALVAAGMDRLRKGERERAQEDFAGAVGLDPHLPDAHLGMALAQAKRGPLGFLPAVRHTVAALTARMPTSRGRYYLLALLIPAGLLTLLATTVVLGLSLLLRHGGLLLHDLEEELGPTRGQAFARAVFFVLLLLPVMAFQGWAWLPLWWLALLFLYMNKTEQAVTALVLLLSLGAGPVSKSLETRILAKRNPVFRAAMRTAEGGADRRAAADLEKAVAENPDDRDLVYLLALQHKKAGRYDDSAAQYRKVLDKEPTDPIALNNLANLEFAKGEFPAAIARYKDAAKASTPAELAATFYYNLSQAHLQKFEFQPATEARAQADRLAGGVTGLYERLWKIDRGGSVVSAVVDLGLSEEQVWAKFAGVERGVGRKNLAGQKVAGAGSASFTAGAVNRFLGFLVVFGLAVLALSRWRGGKLFTLRCVKCGTPFCRRCHLGKVVGDLCTQCYHLFVVKDGVSGPARNQKLLEVQKEDERRQRIFRILSLVSPGAGHIYAQKTLIGLPIVIVWYALLVLALLAGRPLPVTEAPSALLGPWILVPPALVLLVIYVVANRMRPSFEAALPVVRRAPPARRAQAAS
jgi:tetratricopeptide (TPR) repeat protein